MRRAARIDGNQPAIVELLRCAGCRVQSLAQVGGGVPDLLIAYQGRLALIEVKDGARTPSARRLTPAEASWHDEWASAPLFVVSSETEALTVLAHLRGEQ